MIIDWSSPLVEIDNSLQILHVIDNRFELEGCRFRLLLKVILILIFIRTAFVVILLNFLGRLELLLLLIYVFGILIEIMLGFKVILLASIIQIIDCHEYFAHCQVFLAKFFIASLYICQNLVLFVSFLFYLS